MCQYWNVIPVVRRGPGTALVALVLAVVLGSGAASAATVKTVFTATRGNVVGLALGARYGSKSVIVETGILAKGKWKYSKLASLRTDTKGNATVCGSRTLIPGMSLRVRVGSKVVATLRNSRTFVLSGCGWSPPAPTTVNTTPAPSASPVVNPETPTTTTSSIVTASTVVASTTTLSPVTTVPVTTTTVSPSTTTTVAVTTTTVALPASPTALALTTATDTGLLNNDGVTKAASISLKGTAPANASVQAYLDGTSAGTSCTASGAGAFTCVVGSVAEGTHSLTARATVGGVTSNASAGYSVRIDRTAPSFSFASDYAFVGTNGTAHVTITASESGTDFSNSKLDITCGNMIVPDCSKTNFSGSGTSYSVNFNNVNNYTVGGSLAVLSGTVQDLAGNLNTQTVAYSIGLDEWGPIIQSVTWDGTALHVTFDEPAQWMGLWDAAFEDWQGGQFVAMHTTGANLTNLRNPSGDRIHWLVDVTGDMISTLDDPVWRATLHLSVGIGVLDTWNTPISNPSFQIT